MIVFSPRSASGTDRIGETSFHHRCVQESRVPEGPSLVILKEEARAFARKKVVRASGVAAIPMKRITGRRVIALRTWGKHFLIQFDGFTLRIHFLLFGSYLIDARKPDRTPKLRLQFANGEINFYACAIRLIEGNLDEAYDWSADVMSDLWDARSARKKLRSTPDLLACDALLDQNIFSGVGNIIKNEVLFRLRVHPLSQVGALPAAKLRALVEQARQYSFEFLEWKKAGVLKRHWLAHTKKMCPRCHIPLNLAELGVTRRRTFFCNNCQVLYGSMKPKRAVAKRADKARSRERGLVSSR
jgi:endonuclease VIII